MNADLHESNLPDSPLSQRYPDLSQLANECKGRVAALPHGDYELTPAFRTAYERCNANAKTPFLELEFSRYSAVIGRSKGKANALPSVIFREAAEAAPFLRALLHYKKIVVTSLKDAGYEKNEMRDFLVRIRNQNRLDNDTELKQLSADIGKSLLNRFPRETGEERSQALSRILKFATDYSWWLGGKTFDRDDFFVSPVTTAMNKTSNSGEVIPYIVEDYCDDTSLLEAALDLELSSDEKPRFIQNTDRLHTGENVMIYGAPGTGKSWLIENKLYPSAIIDRVVFHPEYSYFDFIGSYKPSPVYTAASEAMLNASGEPAHIPGRPSIDYRFVPGPFIETIVKAYDNPTNEYCLVIEEINRAAAASVFGDMFQLLDRKDSCGSAYCVKLQPDLYAYLCSINHQALAENFRIPSNMSLAATMNNADQGVTFLDTAFKRRWSYTYIPINLERNPGLENDVEYAGSPWTLTHVISAINRRMEQQRINEDRRIGPFYITQREIQQRGTKEALKKVIIYLWDDVFRTNRTSFFDPSLNTLAEVEAALELGDPLRICGLLSTQNEEDSSISDEANDQEM